MKKTLSLITFAILVLTGCKQTGKEMNNKAASEQSTAKPVVYASNYPLYYFARRLGGEHIDLRFPASDMDDPSAWIPPADTVAAMQQADLILLNGATYEGWLMNVSLPDSLLLDTSLAYALRLLPSGEVFTHSHGEEGEHSHEGVASTTWMDLSLATAQVRAIRGGLIRTQPDRTDAFEANYQSLAAELQELHNAYKEATSTGTGKHLAFSHPVYQYFQQAYGLEGSSLHWEPQTPLVNDMMHEIGHLKKEHNIEYLVWESSPLPESVRKLKEQGIESVVIEPLGGMPASGDFLVGMRKNLEVLRRALGSQQ